MVRYNICINIGDANKTVKFFFVHKDWDIVNKEDSDKDFDAAVKELDRIYKNYGRFATEVGVTKLFESFGFERAASE